VAALKIWQNHRQEISLLLSDLVMPGGLTGRELGAKLRQEKANLKIIFVTGYSADIFTGDIALNRRVRFLAKPFAASVLAQTVRACLDES
jgi:FixJ family two-component response regulator